MKDSSFGSFLAGMLIGGIVGAAIGLLLAPASGDEIRGQFGEFVGEKRTSLGEAISEGRAAAEKARAEMLAAYDAPRGGEASESAAT